MQIPSPLPAFFQAVDQATADQATAEVTGSGQTADDTTDAGAQKQLADLPQREREQLADMQITLREVLEEMEVLEEEEEEEDDYEGEEGEEEKEGEEGGVAQVCGGEGAGGDGGGSSAEDSLEVMFTTAQHALETEALDKAVSLYIMILARFSGDLERNEGADSSDCGKALHGLSVARARQDKCAEAHYILTLGAILAPAGIRYSFIVYPFLLTPPSLTCRSGARKAGQGGSFLLQRHSAAPDAAIRPRC
jgi:hypothetical protein